MTESPMSHAESKGPSRRRLLALWVSVAMVLAACSDTTSSSTTAESTDTTEPAVSTTSPDTDATTSTPEPTGDADPIRIGVQSQVTGDGAIVGVPFVQGAEVAAQQINDAGGVDGRMIELVIEDNETRAPAALEAADKLVHVDGLDRIICACFTVLFFPLLEAYADEDVVFVSNMSSSPELRNQPGDFASFIALDDVMVPLLADFAWDQGNRSAGVMMSDDEYGQTIGPAMSEAWSALGGELVLEETLQPGLPDYRAEMQRIAAQDPEILFVITYQADAVIQFTEMEELGWDGDVYVLYPSATAFAEIPGLDGRVFGIESAWLEDESEDFRNAYLEATGEEASYWSALGYDNVALVAQTMAAETEGTVEDFFSSLTTTSETYSGPSGQFSFDEDFIQSNPSLSYLVLQDGSYVPVDGD